MLCQDDATPGEFYSSDVYANTNLWNWTIQLMYVNDLLLIVWHVSHTWYGCWTIKSLEEAEVLYNGFTVSHRCIADPLIIARTLHVSYL
jgi:hypothetical protein